ncbi:hypothetical protein GO295_05062 [Ralstonia solanacearum]|nr:hypothetical protein [Ralstonia solanacearum]
MRRPAARCRRCAAPSPPGTSPAGCSSHGVRPSRPWDGRWSPRCRSRRPGGVVPGPSPADRARPPPTVHPGPALAPTACPVAPAPAPASALPPGRCPPACRPDDPADMTGPAARILRLPSGSPAARPPIPHSALRTAPPAHPDPHPNRSARVPRGWPVRSVPRSSPAGLRALPRSLPACGEPGPRTDRGSSRPAGTAPPSRSTNPAVARARPCPADQSGSPAGCRSPPSPPATAAGSPGSVRSFPGRTVPSRSPASPRSVRHVRARPGRDRTLRCSSRRPGVRWSAHRVSAPLPPCSATTALPGTPGCATGCALA